MSQWLFCSSGARPLYLENVVRALALPSGDQIQYRYLEKIVSEAFRAGVSNGSVVGQRAYLSYLDNREKGRVPRIYPVREAIIRSAHLRGSTYVVSLEVNRFVNWNATNDLSDVVRKSAVDKVPDWDSETGSFVGSWVAAVGEIADSSLVRYEPLRGDHLNAFESTVEALSAGKDFAGGNYLFLNFLGVRDIATGSAVKGNKLHAGRSYEVVTYHYLNLNDPHFEWKPFFFDVSFQNGDIETSFEPRRRVEAEYDEMRFPFRVKDMAENSGAQLSFEVLGHTEDEDDIELVQVNQRYSVAPNWPNRIWRSGGIAVGVGGAQLVTLSSLNKLTTIATVLVIVFSVIAGLASTFRLPGKP